MYCLQIAILVECGGKIKEELREYLKQCTLTVEDHSTYLRQKRDQLENVWSALHQRRKGKRDTEIVNDFVSIEKEINSCQQVRFKQKPRLPQMAYVNEGPASKNFQSCSSLTGLHIIATQFDC